MLACGRIGRDRPDVASRPSMRVITGWRRASSPTLCWWTSDAGHQANIGHSRARRRKLCRRAGRTPPGNGRSDTGHPVAARVRGGLVARKAEPNQQPRTGRSTGHEDGRTHRGRPAWHAWRSCLAATIDANTRRRARRHVSGVGRLPPAPPIPRCRMMDPAVQKATHGRFGGQETGVWAPGRSMARNLSSHTPPTPRTRRRSVYAIRVWQDPRPQRRSAAAGAASKNCLSRITTPPRRVVRVSATAPATRPAVASSGGAWACGVGGVRGGHRQVSLTFKCTRVWPGQGASGVSRHAVPRSKTREVILDSCVGSRGCRSEPPRGGVIADVCDGVDRAVYGGAVANRGCGRLACTQQLHAEHVECGHSRLLGR